jgi:phosphoribosyl 1,2-cyclic phosphodiesterase
MTVTVSVLGSGSRGNSTFIRTDRVRLLIDAGLSRREIASRLESIGEDPDGIDAVLITHEHNDHASGLKTIVKETAVQVHLSAGTMRALQADEYELNGSRLLTAKGGESFRIGDAEILPFQVPHDASEPVAFSVICEGVKITQLTDIGHLPEDISDWLSGTHVLILESNHDVEMLRVGPYPWNLKQRLMGRYGHLSNAAVGKFILDRYDGMAEHFVLAHLSSRNNHPELARQEAIRALKRRGFEDARVAVTEQDRPTAPIRL